MGLSTCYYLTVKCQKEKIFLAASIAYSSIVGVNERLSVREKIAVISNRITLEDFNFSKNDDFDETKLLKDTKELGMDYSFITKNDGTWYTIRNFEDWPYNSSLAKKFEEMAKICGGGILEISSEYESDESKDKDLLGTNYIMPASPSDKVKQEMGYTDAFDYLKFKTSMLLKGKRDEMHFLDGKSIQYEHCREMLKAWNTLTNWYNDLFDDMYARLLKLENKLNLYNFICYFIVKGVPIEDLVANASTYLNEYVEYLKKNNFNVQAMLVGLGNIKKITF